MDKTQLVVRVDHTMDGYYKVASFSPTGARKDVDADAVARYGGTFQVLAIACQRAHRYAEYLRSWNYDVTLDLHGHFVPGAWMGCALPTWSAWVADRFYLGPLPSGAAAPTRTITDTLTGRTTEVPLYAVDAVCDVLVDLFAQ